MQCLVAEKFWDVFFHLHQISNFLVRKLSLPSLKENFEDCCSENKQTFFIVGFPQVNSLIEPMIRGWYLQSSIDKNIHVSEHCI